MKIYVASSWRNIYQASVVAFLKALGHEVYDFKNPAPGNDGFHWREIHPDWPNWSTNEFITALRHPIADDGFQRDMLALENADACMMVLPCGRSAHLEMGWAAGRGMLTVIYIPEAGEAELMYKMAAGVVATLPGIQTALFDGHSMGRYLPCGACGDLEGCLQWQTPDGNEFDWRKNQ